MNTPTCILRLPRRPLQPIHRTFTHSIPRQTLPPFTCRLFKLPTPPTPPSQYHHDLPTFTTYATRSSLPETTPTYIGTHYEYTVQETLRCAGLSLTRTGGRDDAGVDLVGTWHVPGREDAGAIRAIVQCKALRTKAGPNLVRELEGAFRSAPVVGWRGISSKVGVLVCSREATRGVREALARSGLPLVWVMVQRDGVVRQALWNERVERLGLGLLGVEVVFGSEGDGGDGGWEGRRIGFTWDGEEVPHMGQVEEDMLRVQDEWLGLFGELDERERDMLLDVVEELFPEEKPLLTGKRCSALTDQDRARVLDVLHSRIHRTGES